MNKRLDWVIYGAGAIGGTIGARLHKHCETVTLIARGEHARVMQEKGLRFVHPEGDERLKLAVIDHPQQLKPVNDNVQRVILLCMKTQHTAQAISDLCKCEWADGIQDTPVFCVQNGVAIERLAARFFSNVYATVVNLPATHLQPGVVATFAGTSESPGGVLDTSRYPGTTDALSTAVCAGLSEAGFSAAATDHVMAQKYAKLLANLSNALELVLKNRDDFAAAGRALRAEARACYEAAGIDYVPLKAYLERNAAIYQMTELAAVPRGGGSTWQSLQRGAAEVETDYLNGEISLLGQLHTVPTPINTRLQRLAREVIEGRLPAQSLLWQDLAAGS